MSEQEDNKLNIVIDVMKKKKYFKIIKDICFCFFLNVCIKQKKNCFFLLIEKLEDEEEEWFVDINYLSKIIEKFWIVCFVAADKLFFEGRVKEYVGGVFTQK